MSYAPSSFEPYRRAAYFLEGQWPYTRTVVIRFSDESQAKRWYESDQYQTLAQHRLRAAKTLSLPLRGRGLAAQSNLGEAPEEWGTSLRVSYAGWMFGFSRKKLSGSYCALIRRNRSMLPAYAVAVSAPAVSSA